VEWRKEKRVGAGAARFICLSSGASGKLAEARSFDFSGGAAAWLKAR
jgi:hypothetical protein